ncbi:CHAP domain-containing protein [Massilia sp. Dwa41.01b]|uniref:CHAP domain-containing protein n=1 Tax=unclassified Massilia TaxID=2609279 RepID=UPI0015FFE1DE|nr:MULTISPECIES: CHAP domain-containing protein [unclassified Massilia]QNA89287.1 CHAP domain-containing protein [Massilia sp. Dwa41.01b]QNB00189.1 CHAP domain-containing protein [Massilia sp. Se16.2.3]
MMNHRRNAIGGLLAMSVSLALRPVFAQANNGISAEGMEKFDDFPQEFQDGMFRSPDPNKNFGSTSPPETYKAISGVLLRGAPFDCRPIDVAYYFAALREGILPDAVIADIRDIAAQAKQPRLAQPGFLKFFAYDWEKNNYFNPVVVGFFRGNGLKPYAGDETPWCAAFANWCISRSRVRAANVIIFDNQTRALGTRNASSGSFRCWGSEATMDPREGDLVVWAKTGTVTVNCPSVGQGHVAFVTKVQVGAGNKRSYHVVGGNQGFRGAVVQSVNGALVRPVDVAQAVSRRVIGNHFADRVIHSVRTQSFFR